MRYWRICSIMIIHCTSHYYYNVCVIMDITQLFMYRHSRHQHCPCQQQCWRRLLVSLSIATSFSSILTFLAFLASFALKIISIRRCYMLAGCRCYICRIPMLYICRMLVPLILNHLCYIGVFHPVLYTPRRHFTPAFLFISCAYGNALICHAAFPLFHGFVIVTRRGSCS